MGISIPTSFSKTGSAKLYGPITLTEGNNVTLTQSGQDISVASTGFTVGGPALSGTTGSILFVGAGPITAQDNANLFWDNSADRIGIGTSSPGAKVGIATVSAAEVGITIGLAASQSGDALQVITSAAVERFSINSGGQLRFWDSQTETISAGFVCVNLGGTLTMNNSASSIVGYTFNSDITYTVIPGFWIMPIFFSSAATVRLQTAATLWSGVLSYNSGTTYISDGVASGMFGTFAAYEESPAFSVANSGTWSTSDTYTSYKSRGTVNAGATIGTRRGFVAADYVGSGTIATRVGFDCEAIAKATTNIAYRSQGTAQSQFGGSVKIGAASAPAVACDITGWILYSGASRVSAQFDKSSNTTLGNITGLTATVVAGRSYRFSAMLFYDANATGGHKYAIGGTATATSIIYEIVSVANATNLNVITSRQTALAGAAGQAGSTAGVTTIDGLITVNAGGTVTVQFAQNAATGTSSILVGSFFELWDIA